MIKIKKMSWQQLQNSYQPSDFSFETTEDITGVDGIIGQEEALEALQFGLNLTHKGYNVFVASETSNEFINEITNLINDRAKSQQIPDDLCYVYNFKSPTNPKVIYMEAGDGKILQDDMKEFSCFLQEDLLNKIENSETIKQKQDILNKFETKKLALLSKLEEEISNLGFMLNIAEGTLALIPLRVPDNPTIELEIEQEQNSQLAKALAQLVIDEVGLLEENSEIEINNLLEEKIMQEAWSLIKFLKNKYRHYPELDDYFSEIFDDIIENSEAFLQTENSEVESLKGILPIMIGTKDLEDITKKYEVNLFVDNSHLEGAPVIFSRDLGYSKMIGSINIKPDQDLSVIDVLALESGLLHKARGGYLILKAQDVVETLGTWQALKQALRDEVIKIQNPPTASVNQTKYIEPTNIDLNIKVILVGDFTMHQLFTNYDLEFSELFKLKIDFEDELSYTKTLVEQIGYKVKQQCEKENLHPVTCEALLKVIRYTQERKDKVNTDMAPIYSLIREADSLAEDFITLNHVDTALKFKKTMLGKLNKNMRDNYKQERILINVNGKKVGQVNGLAVYGVGEDSIGQPIKITATTYKGRKGVINVEKAAGLSGNIHNKGVEVVEGFLGYHFAQDLEPSLSCKICMEQSYSNVDGDSASSAELYAIISSLAQLPINQNLAVTGSINQFGEIQPVGGLSEKIEGFFAACKEKGITKSQGVIIPYQNQVDLILSEEVIQAIKDGDFHIYPIKRYEQGV